MTDSQSTALEDQTDLFHPRMFISKKLGSCKSYLFTIRKNNDNIILK